MKKIIMILSIAFIASCSKDEVEPITSPINADCEDYCKCGEVIHADIPDTETWVIKVRNNCSGEMTTIYRDNHIEEGNDVCLDYCW